MMVAVASRHAPTLTWSRLREQFVPNQASVTKAKILSVRVDPILRCHRIRVGMTALWAETCRRAKALRAQLKVLLLNAGCHWG